MIDIRTGDCRELMAAMPAGSVRCCVTSPPYWGLRDYGHPGQLGLERTPEGYVSSMVNVFREVRRVLADDGTLWLNLGDSYSGGGGYAPDALCNQARANGDPAAWGKFHPAKMDRVASRRGTGRPGSARADGKARDDSPRNRDGLAGFSCGLAPKNLVGIPWRVAFALQADGWWLRSDIIWAKPNPMPESVTDRPTKAHEYLFLLSKSASYYYDAGAVAEPRSTNSHGSPNINPGSKARSTGHASGSTTLGKCARRSDKQRGHSRRHAGFNDRWDAMEKEQQCSGTRNRRSVWTVPTQPFAEAHFAVMPEALVEPCVLAGSAPGDLVLDPFAGSGTVGVVALRHGRRFLGCELNAEYVQMAHRRISGPLFAEEANP